MAAGKPNSRRSPIIRAIQEAERFTTGEIRVHLSHRVLEKDPYRRAIRLFHEFELTHNSHRNTVLLYVNLRKRKFAIIGDKGLHQAVGQSYWEDLAKALAADLRSTHPENAIALAIRTLGVTLSRFFPVQAEQTKSLPDDTVTED